MYGGDFHSEIKFLRRRAIFLPLTLTSRGAACYNDGSKITDIGLGCPVMNGENREDRACLTCVGADPPLYRGDFAKPLARGRRKPSRNREPGDLPQPQ